MVAYTLNKILDRGADWAKVLTLLDSAGDPIPLNPAVIGVKQVVTNTVVGTVTTAGNVTIPFVSALTGTLGVLVPVLVGNTATIVAKRAAAALNANRIFAAHWVASASGADILATAKIAANNDATVSLPISTSGLGITQDLTSVATTAGVAQVFGEFAFEGQLRARSGSSPLADYRFEIVGDGTSGQVRIIFSEAYSLLLAGGNTYAFDWFIYRNGTRVRTVEGQAKARGNVTAAGTSAFGTPSLSLTTWGSITGSLADQTDLQLVLDDKLEDITGLIEAGTNVTLTGSGTAASPYVISSSGGGGGGGGTWGSITGTLSNQTDLNTALNGKQPLDATLTALAALTTSSNTFIYSTGPDTFAQSAVTAFARTLLDDATSTVARSTLGLAIGSDVVAYSASLDSWAGVTRASGFDTFTGTPSSANLRSLLTDEKGTGVLLFDGADGVNFGEITTTVGSSSISTVGGAIVIVAGAPNTLDITASVGVNITGPIFYAQGSDAIGDIYYRDSNGQLKRLAIGSTGQVLRVSGGLPAWTSVPVEICIACSDETTALTTGNGKATFRMPHAMTLTSVRASVTTAPTGSTLIVDINESGSTILSTKLSVDASEKTSTTAASAAVISDTTLADDAEITIDIDQIGSSVAGAGLKVTLIGTR